MKQLQGCLQQVSPQNLQEESRWKPNLEPPNWWFVDVFLFQVGRRRFFRSSFYLGCPVCLLAQFSGRNSLGTVFGSLLGSSGKSTDEEIDKCSSDGTNQARLLDIFSFSSKMCWMLILQVLVVLVEISKPGDVFKVDMAENSSTQLFRWHPEFLMSIPVVRLFRDPHFLRSSVPIHVYLDIPCKYINRYTYIYIYNITSICQYASFCIFACCQPCRIFFCTLMRFMF